jgi:hypothetical protein
MPAIRAPRTSFLSGGGGLLPLRLGFGVERGLVFSRCAFGLFPLLVIGQLSRLGFGLLGRRLGGLAAGGPALLWPAHGVPGATDLDRSRSLYRAGATGLAGGTWSRAGAGARDRPFARNTWQRPAMTAIMAGSGWRVGWPAGCEPRPTVNRGSSGVSRPRSDPEPARAESRLRTRRAAASWTGRPLMWASDRQAAGRRGRSGREARSLR